ncbi:MAG: DUF389 domain-containing protein [Candidatus Nanopelagicales bacterium]|nr:DUF389 domain-containing protein [Candidatus Nanopelagicales bacterium]
MLHVRVYSPADLTDAVVGYLKGDAAVSQMAVLRSVATQPAPDLIMAEVVREAANDVVNRLRDLGVPRQGAIQITPVQTWISQRELDAELTAPGASADAVVWADVIHRAYEDTEINKTYVAFMTMALMIAAIGIVIDSQILLIGAMVLGPEFGAVAALGLSLVRRRRELLFRALRTLAMGYVIAIAVTSVAAAMGRWAGWISEAEATGPRPLTGFIYSPDQWSVLVALIAGAAGVLALTSSKSGELTGVLISVATVPAAGNVAVGLAFAAWSQVWGSTLQLFVNITAMAFSGWLTLMIKQHAWGPANGRGEVRQT